MTADDGSRVITAGGTSNFTRRSGELNVSSSRRYRLVDMSAIINESHEIDSLARCDSDSEIVVGGDVSDGKFALSLQFRELCVHVSVNKNHEFPIDCK